MTEKTEMAQAFEIPMFRSGKWNGKQFNNADLERAAVAYDPTLRKATILETHQGTEPLGTIYKFEFKNGWLTAFSNDLSEKAQKLLKKAGKRSIGFLPPGHPENPTKSLLLDHVALGVNNPAVAGIPDANLITFESLEEKTMDEKQVTELFSKLFADELEKIKEEKPKKTEMELQLENKVVQLEADKKAANERSALVFAKTMADSNKIHPSQVDKLAFALSAIADDNEKLEFGDKQITPIDAIQDVLSNLPSLNFAEQTKPDAPNVEESDAPDNIWESK